jgi:hypothetical protein
VIGFEHQEVVGALGPDLRGDVLLAAQRIQRTMQSSRRRVSSNAGAAEPETGGEAS